MNPQTLPLLALPGTDEGLELATIPGPDREALEVLRVPGGATFFPIRDGVPVFVDPAKVTGLNRKYRDLYDRFSPFYDLAQRLFYSLRGGEAAARNLYLKELEVKPGDRVLEVSVGTGANLWHLPRQASFYGLDLSWGQLSRCRKMLRRTGLSAELFLGEAENLPFHSETFDVVFHIGGINFFNDKRRAILEMIRVAKPGCKIVIVDETEELAQKAEQISPFFRNRPAEITAPVALVPPEMLETQAKEIRNGELFLLSFRKPPREGRPPEACVL